MVTETTKVLQFPTERAGRRVLVAEGEVVYRELWTTFLESEGYIVEIATDGHEALALARSMAPDIVLIEILLPDMSGLEVASRLRHDRVTESTPIIMITSHSDRNAKLRGLEAGAHDFLEKPFDRIEMVVRIRNLLRLKDNAEALGKFSQVLVETIEERTHELRDSQREALWILMRAIETRESGPLGHGKRVSLDAATVAEQLGLRRDFRDQLLHAAALHDIGDVAIPDRILEKQAPLEPGELEVLRSHCVAGARILRDGRSPYMKMAADIALNHHENWDGSGYPNGRNGESIPLAARIVHIVDVYDGLRHRRDDRPGLGHDEAVNAITTGNREIRPDFFDPAIINAFRDAGQRIAEIHNANG